MNSKRALSSCHGEPRRTMVCVITLFIAILLSSCNEEYMPKPRGFFRIELPKKSYIHFSPPSCPFEFDVPVYATISRDTLKDAEPCFMNVDFTHFNATLYLSYKKINKDLPKLLEDHRNMTMKHIPRASAINEEEFNDAANKVYGSYYSVKGNAASNVQFYLTDSINHFIRASLYFNNPPQPDSIAPVLDFLTEDIKHIVETFKWK